MSPHMIILASSDQVFVSVLLTAVSPALELASHIMGTKLTFFE